MWAVTKTKYESVVIMTELSVQNAVGLNVSAFFDITPCCQSKC